MPICHLSSPRSSYKDGYEIASFEVNIGTINSLFELEEEHQVHSFISYLYRGTLPIHPEYDIKKIDTKSLGKRQYEITVTIRRGWWFLREFLLTHMRVEVERYGEVTELRCTQCGEQEFYPSDAFPRSKYVERTGECDQQAPEEGDPGGVG